MKNSTSKILFTYWNEVRGNRVAPRRFEIEPARLAPVLPDAFILERLGDLNIRYRLAGTRLIEQFGFEFRGESFFNGYEAEDRTILERMIRSMTQEGGGALFELVSTSQSGREVEHECLVLPLVHMRDTVDRFVGVLSPNTVPDWLGDEPLVAWRIAGHQMIRPDGGSAGVVPFPMSLDSNVRAARIVRSDRRQFRVYEGGLAGSVADES